MGDVTRQAQTTDPSSLTRVDPSLARVVNDMLLGSPVARAIGLCLETLDIDRAVLGLPFKAENVTVADIVHGGVIATLIDVAGVAAGISGCAPAGFNGCATSGLSISFLSAAKGAALRAEALALRRSRRQAVVEVSVFAGQTLIAKALATISLF